MGKKILIEEYCAKCDANVHAIVDEERLTKGKVGRIRCDNGHIVMPCNQCDGDENHRCNSCPWKDADIVDAIDDRTLLLWYRKNEPTIYELYRKGKIATYYVKLCEEIEKEESEPNDRDLEAVLSIMKSFGYVLYDTTDTHIVFRDTNDNSRLYDRLIQFKCWNDVKKYCDDTAGIYI